MPHRRSSSPRHGACLDHGVAHAADHRAWSRRDFLAGLGLAAGGSLVLGRMPVQAFGASPLLARLRDADTDRVLVLIQLDGGNDGLNTVIPVDDDRYYLARPRLAIRKSQTLSLASGLGFHPSFAPLRALYDDDRMAVVQSVGYPMQDLSHFRSTDIWMSASEADAYLTTGWTGRYLETAYPVFEETPLDYPLAVQLGGLASMLFQGSTRNMGMSLTNPELFERLVEEGRLYDAEAVPATAFGREVGFLRTVANDAFRYATAIQRAAETGVNRVTYPDDDLAWNLAAVARLIKGDLGARIYHVALSGFDTHADQANQHATLLRRLAEAVAAFQQDLDADGRLEAVLTMTFSEFGRRVEENGSGGTDHGTAAPLFLFGPGVRGGLYGTMPALDDLNGDGNMHFGIDFRAVYATILRDWFGLDGDAAAAALGHAFDPLPFVADPATPTAAEAFDVPHEAVLHPNYPNPFNPQTTLTYTLPQPMRVRLTVYDVRGRLVRTLVDAVQATGTHTATFDAGALPSGPYLYRLELPHTTYTRTMVLVR